MSIEHQDDFDHVGQAQTMLCEHCDKYCDPRECMEDECGEVICQSCRENRDEAAYERQQEKLMQDGPDTSIQDRLDQQLRDAGRGHLLPDVLADKIDMARMREKDSWTKT